MSRRKERLFKLTICICLIIAEAFAVFLYINRDVNLLEEPLEIPSEIDPFSAMQMDRFLNEKMESLGVFKKRKYLLGEIEMTLDKERKGEMIVTYAEPNSKRPRVLYAYIDMEKGVVENIKKGGRDSKLYPGQIHLANWKVDSWDAIRIAEEYLTEYTENERFHYDEIWLRTYSDTLVDYAGTKEDWIVSFRDNEDFEKGSMRIDPYSGKVHSFVIR